jgi:acetolactate synthase-1/2/3 large subunit
MRKDIGKALGQALLLIDEPVIVDDSQIFGGMLSRNYDEYPANLRVFGDHGAFIGGGYALAAGFSIIREDKKTVCTLGDQSFTNALQILSFIKQQKPNLLAIVCNNGESVSLKKQAQSQSYTKLANREKSFLNNIPQSGYAKIAQAFGIESLKLDLSDKLTGEDREKAYRTLDNTLKKLVKQKGPQLLELILPNDLSAWEGVWAVSGNDNKSKPAKQ